MLILAEKLFIIPYFGNKRRGLICTRVALLSLGNKKLVINVLKSTDKHGGHTRLEK